jgi:hypothetical protein
LALLSCALLWVLLVGVFISINVLFALFSVVKSSLTLEEVFYRNAALFKLLELFVRKLLLHHFFELSFALFSVVSVIALLALNFFSGLVESIENLKLGQESKQMGLVVGQLDNFIVHQVNIL